jgi:pimeloyl-ACP methyl ester carboxylesterase
LRQRHPDADVASQRLINLTAYFRDFVTALPEKPILIGHSMGGLITQLLCRKGLAAGGYQQSIRFSRRGIFTFKFSFYKAGWPALGFLPIRKKPTSCPFRMAICFHQRHAFEAQKEAYYKLLVPESKLLVRDATTPAAKVDFSKAACPLLFLSGSEDRFIPASLNYQLQKIQPLPVGD